MIEEKVPLSHIAMVSPEVTPFAKSGGLADAASGLALALERLGLKITIILPAYRSVLKSQPNLRETALSLPVTVSDREGAATVLKNKLGNEIGVYAVRADQYYDRDSLYATSDGDYPDNAERFAFFSRAALEILRYDPPQILHCHDWQSALAIAFYKAQPERYAELNRLRTVFTIHNLGYQGLFSYSDWHLLNLDHRYFSPSYLEFYGKINFLKAGLVFADAITTVSPTYAEEIKTAEQGFGLEGVLRERSANLVGILNGADYSLWNPGTDPFVAKNYSIENLSQKKICKADVQRTLGLPESPDIPFLAMVSRLTSQKGFDLLEKMFDELLRRELQFAVLGTGEKRYESFFKQAANRYPGKVAVKIGFDEALAHRIEAGADLFLMPSLYEPCGLNQIYSLKYGTIPIVRATGGLRDTVRDYTRASNGTGFVFGPYEPSALLQAVDRALELFSKKEEWRSLIKRAMREDFSWNQSAKAYLDLYQKLSSIG
jgi:starch synthase